MKGLLSFREGRGSCSRSLRGMQSETERRILAKNIVDEMFRKQRKKMFNVVGFNHGGEEKNLEKQ